MSPSAVFAQNPAPLAEAGRVIEVTNTWFQVAKPETALKRGDVLQPGEAIRPKDPASNAAIAVMLRNGKIIGRNCSQKTCEQAFVIPSGTVAESSIFTDMCAWLSRIANNPKAYTGTLARGGQPTDAVLLLHNGKIDFAPAMMGLNSDFFQLTLTPLQTSGQRPVSHIRMKWKRGARKAEAVTTAKPGLHEVTFEGRNYSIWVLLANDKEYAGLRRAFEQTVQTTEQWNDVSKQTRITFRRAELDRLASEESSREASR